MAVRFLLLLFLHIFQTSDQQLVFTSKYNGNIVTGSVGSSVNFTWRFSGAIRRVHWGIKEDEKNNIDRYLVSLDDSGISSVQPPQDYTGRVSGSGGPSSGQAMFTLTSIRRNDGKYYACLIQAKPGQGNYAFDSVYLFVEEEPNITLPAAAITSYNEGSPVNISCKATGLPDPDVRWIHNGHVKSFGPETAYLTFNKISKAEAGIYTCRANNSAGTKEKHLNIAVNYKPVGTIIKTSVQNTAVEGDNVTLTCHVTDANPPVSEYRFYVNNSNTPLNTIKNSKQYTIQVVQRSKHYGEYKCVAHNNVGDGQSNTVVLNINVPANIQFLTPNLTVNEHDVIDLRCDVSGYPAPNISWKKGGKQIKPTGKELHINISKRSDTGAYVCTADNSVGQAAHMKTYVVVNYQATITYIPSFVNKLWIGEKVTLTCTSDGVPTPTMSWFLPNGTKLNAVEAKKNEVDVPLNSDGDFGLYNCTADNGFLLASKTVLVEQIKAPSSPVITSTEADIQATSLTVKWTAPTDTGGSPITAYRVVILKGAAKKKDDNITDPAERSWPSGGLEINTNYTVKVFARNYVFEGNAVGKIFKTKFEGIPAAAEIINLPANTKQGDVIIKWNTPKNNGATITEYAVYQRIVSKDGTPQNWTRLHVITDVSVRNVTVQLVKGKIYEFVVTATNKYNESLKEEEKIKRITVGDVPEAVVVTGEINDGEISLKWEEPDNNGAVITQYDIYQRIVNDKTWTNIGTIKDTSKREFVVEGEKGKDYEFAVTATNKYGESSREEDSITRVEVPGGTDPDAGADTQSGGMNTPIIAGAAAVGVLLIIGLIIFAVWWKRRKTPRDGASLSGTSLRNGNEIEDGYQDVSPAAAAQGLQASGPVAEPNYAEVNVSQKKKNRRPVIDEYAQVDRSKKTKKKPKKQPGELDYAELDDLRPRPQPAPVPSGANARPVVRPPAYEGTLYADIAQFGVPQPEPTYDNMPRKDVVYSNVESM